MNRYVYILYLTIFLGYINIFAMNFIPYDEKIFAEITNNWVEPYQFYSSGHIISVSNDKVEIDLGIEDGIQKGFVYDVYQNDIQIGKIVIIDVKNEYSIATTNEKIKNFYDGDQIVFTNQIDLDENSSYANRAHIPIISTINFVDQDSGICFINGEKNKIIKKSTKFNVFDKKNNPYGLLEIIEDSGKDNIYIAQIIDSQNKINVGDKVANKQRDASEWMELATKLEKDESSELDAIYAYEMSLILGGEPKSFLKNKLLDLVIRNAKKYEVKQQPDKSLLIRKKILGFTEETDREYRELKDTALEQAKEYWNAKFYIRTIKFYEILDKDETAVKYLSFSYNGVGEELAEKNPEAAIYCFEKAVKLMPSNWKAWKNLGEIYENLKNYTKSRESFEKMLANTTEIGEKVWIADKIEEIKLKEKNIVPDIIFQDLDEEKKINIRTLKGKMVLIIIWSFDNQSSDDNLDYINTYVEKNGRSKIKALIINNQRTTASKIRNYLSEKRFDYLEPVFLFDDKTSFIKSLFSFPFLNILIDQNGKLLYQKEEVFGEEIEKAIKSTY